MGVGACRRLATTCWDGTRADFGRQGIGTHGAQALPLVPQGFPESQPKVGRPPPQEPPPSSQETRTQGGKTGPSLYATLLGGGPASPRSMPRPLLRPKGGLVDKSSNEGA